MAVVRIRQQCAIVLSSSEFDSFEYLQILTFDWILEGEVTSFITIKIHTELLKGTIIAIIYKFIYISPTGNKCRWANFEIISFRPFINHLLRSGGSVKK